MARYLVTGGAGFIGANQVRALVKKNEDVVVLDNLSTGKLSNFESIQNEIRFLKGDICDLSILKKACDGIDYIIHLAAIRAVGKSIDDPLETNQNNITGTLNVLVAAKEAKVKRVVYASSSSVYGNCDAPYNIETLPNLPESPYAVTKLAGEHYCKVVSQLYNLETVSLRYFNVFGPYQNSESKYSAVIPIFIKQLLQKESPEIHWDGHQSRDFTYVDNIVEANMRAATEKGVIPGEAYNIGSGENTSINQLYDLLQNLLGVDIQPKRLPKRAGDIYKTHADISKAKRDFGYQPCVLFAEGLRTSIDWYKTNL